MNERIGMDEDERYIVKNGNLIDKGTGEIIDVKSLFSNREKALIEEYDQLKEDARNSDVPIDIKVTVKKNKRHQSENAPVTIKEKFEFDKMYRVELIRIFDAYKLDINELAFIARFTPYISFPQNYIRIDGTFPSIETMASKMNVKERTIYNVLTSLEKYEIIYRERHKGYTIIYINPFLYAGGYKVSEDTVKLFEKSSSNPLN
jgi:hypothetical protein